MRESIKVFKRDGFKVELFDTGRADWRGQTILDYTLTDEHWPVNPVFNGTDFSGSPMHADDSTATLAALLCFLSLQRGDTDAEYFDKHTTEQLAWRDARAEELSMIQCELQEVADSGHDKEWLLEDDGTMNTVVSWYCRVCGDHGTERFDSESARNDDGPDEEYITDEIENTECSCWQ